MTPVISFRSVEPSDLPIFFAHQLDADATRMAAFPARDRAAFMAHWEKILADETTIVNTIVFNGSVAGNMVSWVHEGDRKVGYWLGKEYWGKGISSAALTQFLGQVKMRPLYAHVAKHNLASIRVLQKCGFKLSHSVEEASNDADASHVLLTLTA